MLELLTFALFIAAIVGSLVSSVSILFPLLFGYFLFVGYGVVKGHGVWNMVRMSFQGVRKVKNLLIVFGLIGIMTAMWRASGVIPTIVYLAAQAIVPNSFLLIAFLLNCAVSVLTGTAFGTVATIGVICINVGSMMGVDPLHTGGAIMSGIYFGDRCSPMSSVTILICDLTRTDIYRNIRGMAKTALWPLVAACAAYAVLGHAATAKTPMFGVLELFPKYFTMHWTVLLPAAAIIVMSLFRIGVKWTMTCSIAVCALLCVFVQGMAAGEILWTMVYGFHSESAELASLLNGGGIASMLRVAAIVCISSSYAGIFDNVGILDSVIATLQSLARKTSPFIAVLITSIVTGMVVCNQTLTVMLSYQLGRGLFPDSEKLALSLEDTAVVIPPLIPWSIAAAVPLEAISAPAGCLLFAFFLYFIPLWNALRSLRA